MQGQSWQPGGMETRESTQDTATYENQAYQEWEQHSRTSQGGGRGSSVHPSDINTSAAYYQAREYMCSLSKSKWVYEIVKKGS